MEEEKKYGPTTKRLEEARRRGIVAKSSDLVGGIIFIGMLILAYFYWETFLWKLQFILEKGLKGELTLEDSYWEFLWVMWPIFLCAMLFGVLGNVIQVGLTWGWGKGAVSSKIELLKFLGIVIVVIPFMGNLSLVILGCIGVFFGVGLLDYFFQKKKVLSKLRLTHREFQEELKQVLGNLKTKSKIQQGINPAVWSANVIIRGEEVVALKYNPESMVAPICIDKGKGKRGDKILKLARNSKIPIVENSGLAREMYLNLTVGGKILPQHYHKVAQALVWT